MKFAAFYHYDYESVGLKDEWVDEYNVMFNPEKNDYSLLQKRVSEWNKRINLLWVGKFNIEDIKLLTKLNDNIYIRVTIENLPHIQEIKENGIKFFLDSSIMIHSYSLFDWAINDIKPAEIYIGDDLFFNIKEVYNLCKKNDIALRIILNKVQTNDPITWLNSTAPFVRPEDYALISMYFSTGELSASSSLDPNDEYSCNCVFLSTLYNRYFLDKEWGGDLRYLNKDISVYLPNSSIPSDLTEYKLNCKHRCTSSSNSVCTKCRRYIKLAKDIMNIESENNEAD